MNLVSYRPKSSDWISNWDKTGNNT